MHITKHCVSFFIAAMCVCQTVRANISDELNALPFDRRVEEVVVGLPQPWYEPGKEPETQQQRADRLRMVADVVLEQSKNAPGWWWSYEDLVWAVIAKTYAESHRFDINIHNGKVKGDHGHSVCLGQIWGGGKKLIGVDRESTTRCIAKVIYHLTFHQHRCLNERVVASAWSMAIVFSGYGTGWACNAKFGFAIDRARMWLNFHEGKFARYIGEN